MKGRTNILILNLTAILTFIGFIFFAFKAHACITEGIEPKFYIFISVLFFLASIFLSNNEEESEEEKTEREIGEGYRFLLDGIEVDPYELKMEFYKKKHDIRNKVVYIRLTMI